MTDNDHGPVEEKHKAQLRALAEAINDLFPELGWVVLMFDWGDHSRMNYISNAARRDMIKALKELIGHMEQHARREEH